MEKKIYNINVPLSYSGIRIDKFLQSQLNQLSRTRLQNLIQEGFIKLNNNTIYEVSKKIKGEDKIIVYSPSPKKTLIKPFKMKLNILFEDDDIIIINKAPGTVVHPGAGNYERTIVNGLLFKYKNKLSTIGGVLRPGIVHRIDKDTSGIIVVAKNDNAHINLSKQFSDHSIKRSYEALVWGVLKPKNGKIEEKISRSIKNRQLMSVRKDKGKNAITNYKTLKIFQNLETGRTHQIRVHMNFKGNSILGDKSYGKTKKKFKKINLNIEKKINNFGRQALHAQSLGFIHPRTGKEIFFKAEKPMDFQILIKNLEKASI